MQNDNEQPENDALKIDPEDRLTETPRQGGLSPLLILGAIALIGVIVVVYLFSGNEPAPPAPEPAPVVVPEPEPEEPAPAPDIPEPAPEPEPEPEAPQAPTEPPGHPGEQRRARYARSCRRPGPRSCSILPSPTADLLQRGTGVIDGLSRGLVLNKILPVTAPKGKFTTIRGGRSADHRPGELRPL